MSNSALLKSILDEQLSLLEEYDDLGEFAYGKKEELPVLFKEFRHRLVELLTALNAPQEERVFVMNYPAGR